MRTCTKCAIAKPPTEYLARKGTSNHYTQCKACMNEVAKAWDKRNPQRARERGKRWCVKHPEKNKQRYDRSNAKRYSDPAIRLEKLIRNAVYHSLSGRKKCAPTFVALGYSRDDLAAHLERQFLPRMTWENYGQWHLDHIIPLSSFNIESSSDQEFRAAWALTNLRPLWATENIRKHAKRTHLI